MIITQRICTFLVLLALAALPARAADYPSHVTWEGDGGIGQGKHIVYIASDHEYRGEEVLPALARILAKHYGFKCTVIFGTNPEDGTIQPGSSHLEGLEILKDADLMVIFMRFISMPDEEMQHFVNYVDRGGPIVALRTSTHAFKIEPDRKFYSYDFRYPGEEFHMGFGRQVLGETWVTHYGQNHEQGSILGIEPENGEHPILRGVTDMHTQAGGYTANPLEPGTILARGIILNGMEKDAPVDSTKTLMPVAWTRDYVSKSGTTARIFTTTQGASQDILSDGFRRMLVNAQLWAVGMDDAIAPDGDISFVGPYNPTDFSFKTFRRGVKAADIAGWDTPIWGADVPIE